MFEQFYASQVPSTTEATRSEALARAAGCALLQRIGPSVLLSHSQGGPVAWGIADSRPELVSNSLEIASYLQHWIADHVCGKARGPGFR